jgi:hypothetical protein
MTTRPTSTNLCVGDDICYLLMGLASVVLCGRILRGIGIRINGDNRGHQSINIVSGIQFIRR